MSNNKLAYLILGLIVATIVLIRSATFTVGEWQSAIVTQFGKIIGEPVTEAGLHFKMPFIHDVRYFDRRMINWDGEPAQVPTRDKKFIIADTTARWRVKDPVKFLQTVQTEQQASRRITSIIDARVKTVISNHNLVETVRNTNNILEMIQQKEEASTSGEDSMLEVDEQITGEIEKIEFGREKLSEMIVEEARQEIESLGIELIDVLIRRIAYEASVEAKVYERMISERTRVAEEIRSIGKGEEAKIRGQLELDLKRIESEAYKKALAVRGKADAEAIEIFAQAVGKDTEFFVFLRTLDAYKASLPGRAKMIMSTDSEFLRLLKKAK